MHSLKKKKNNLSSNTHQTEHVQNGYGSVCLIRRRGGTEKSGSNSLFTQCRGLTP
ncbi:unnamed protein product [Staurois parvus]|uniref:Uncharacterized protein n=1 Tax=Staurois parvus TaxID=386267 RepID=A0ABN9BK30_9NEOB|nr:unnamed protein product [Staurois parvus]